MRDKLVPKDSSKPDEKHDYGPSDEVEGVYAYGCQENVQRGRNRVAGQ